MTGHPVARRIGRALSVTVRAGTGAVAVSRLARAAFTAPPVRPTHTPSCSISVVIPARDEARRIGPLLATIVGAPGVDEVIVVDDCSSDDTARLAAAAGATVVRGAPLPGRWAGKAWALHQGAQRAAGDWVVALDADTRPDPVLPSALVARATGDNADFVSAAGRFDLPTPGARWLHPAMLTTLVYRFGPPGASMPAGREFANGQCMAFHRARFLAAGGFGAVRGDVVEDVAIARHVARTGGRVAFVDASGVLSVEMYDSLSATWRGWTRSLALPGVDPRRRQLAGLAVVAVAQALPLARVLMRRGDVVDAAMLAIRVGTLAGTRSAYSRVGPAYWASPLADVAATAAIAIGVARGHHQTWRGRRYR